MTEQDGRWSAPETPQPAYPPYGGAVPAGTTQMTAPPPGSAHPGPTSDAPTTGPPTSGTPTYAVPTTGGPAGGYPPPPPGYGPPPGYAAQPAHGGRAGRVVGIAFGAVLLAVTSGLVGGAVVSQVEDNGGGQTVITRNPAPNLDRSSVASVAAAVLPSVVDISTNEGEGSGVILSSDGQIITNNHVVDGSTELTVTFSDGKTARASVVGTDPAGDVAVIKAEGVSGLSAAKFGDSDSLRVGDTVLAVGSPLGLQGSVTSGIVSALHRTISAGEGGGRSISDAIQTDAAINPGNSGGALVNLAGEVVGINTAIATSGQNSGNIGVGFAISSNRARSAADQLVKGGKVSHPYLGVQLTDGTGGGALIADVVAGGPAAKAGLQRGDVVTEAGGQQINDATDLINAVQGGKVGDQLKLTVQRNGSEQQITVTLGETQ